VATFVSAALSVLGVDSFSLYIFILAFPAGLTAILTQNYSDMTTWSNIFGWLIYISMSVVAILVKDRQLFVLIYAFFVILLLMNITGCNLLIQEVNFGF
jgi:hypothetical protein